MYNMSHYTTPYFLTNLFLLLVKPFILPNFSAFSYQATVSDTLWTPETSVIDLLMRNLEKIGDARHQLKKVVNWLGSLSPVSEDLKP